VDAFHKIFKNLKKDSVIKQLQCELKCGNKPTCSGTVYITNLSLCFKGNVFGSKQKWYIRFSDIESVNHSPKMDKLIVNSTTKGQIIIKRIGDTGATEQTEILLNTLHDQNKNETSTEDVDEASESEQEEALKISDDDWVLILAGTKVESYEKNVHIIEQDKFRKARLFQIKEGCCRIEKELENGNVFFLGKNDKFWYWFYIWRNFFLW